MELAWRQSPPAGLARPFALPKSFLLDFPPLLHVLGFTAALDMQTF